MTRYFGTVAAVCWPLLAPAVFAGSEAQSLSAQVEPEPSYESRFVETRGVRIQYADFGGSGLPVVFVQGIHDFSPEEQPYSALLSRLADEFRLLAPVRRGYGGSDDTGWGYDVATQAEDLLGFLDALGIRRAVLVGGPPAPQEMTWIAEHHPERLAGLVFLANPHVEPDFREPEVRAFAENYWRGSCDLGETAVGRIGPRAAWRPHFLDDDTARIDIPALRFFWPGSTLRSMDLRRLDRVEQMAASEPACDGEAAAREYFAALAADEERLAVLRHALTESVQVAPPTGVRAADRASILAALDQAGDGDTVQFAAGTYLLGGFIPVSVSGVTLLGHRNGTTLRGCDPAGRSAPDSRTRCNTLALVGSRQVVRNLTFEYMSWGLTVGFEIRGSREHVFHAGEGGHLIEGNTFRDSGIGVRAAGDWPSPVVVRGNRFVNTYHAGDIAGRGVHFLNNDISAPDPTQVVPFRHVGGATQITPLDPVPGDVGLPAAGDCEDNVIAGNRYDGHPDAIVMYISREGSCRNNVIRGNTIVVRRARVFADRSPGSIRHETDSTLVGIPLVLADWSEEDSTESRGVIENNVIEGNRIIGAEGLGMMLHRASRNRVADNTITGIRRREPFPGNVLWGIDEEQWRHANGSAIWVSPESDGNEIIGNTFEDVAAAVVVLEGDSNRVETRSASDAVRDLGRANRVRVGAAPPQAAEEVRARTDAFLAALSDDSPTFVSPFYAPDAVLVLAGGATLEGREAIVRGFLRPRVPPLRGVRALSEELVGGGDTVTWKGAIAARIAPAADTVRGAFSATWARQPDGEWRIAASTVDLPNPGGEAENDPVRSGFFESAGARLHYLDFGGVGVPLVFMPNRDRTAYTFIDFAPRFTDQSRVLAVTSRGTGESGGEWDGAPDIAALGRDVIALLDSLGLERAVVAHAWVEVLVYLAEQHPGRVAGLVFLGGMPQPALPALWDADTTGILEMVPRLAASWDGADPDEAMRRLRERWYPAQHLRGDRAIDIPALVFRNESEASSVEDRWETDLRYAGWVAAGELAVPDSATRAYFLRLASDEAAQAEVRAVYRDLVAPAHRVANERFRRAFGEHLRVIPLEERAIGYGYREAPELIEPHIRRFLDGVGEREQRRLTPSTAYAQRADFDTVDVAAPTGEKDIDRASILAALDQVEPGGTIRFAPGTYLIGEIIHVTVPRITLLGHPLGTTLRGCHPADFPESPEGLPELFVAGVRCNGLDMAGGHQRVMNLTFEYAWHALVLGGMECLEGRGCVPVLEPIATRGGGYLVEGNTFRNSGNGVRTIGEWTEPAVIRENRFVNTFHAAVVHGSTVHIFDNDISVPEPEQVPSARHPGIALSLSATDLNVELALRCTGNVIAGNRIEGHPDGISIALFRPGTSCRENVIRDNTIRVARVRVPASWAAVTLTDADSSVVGVPLALVGSLEAFGDLPIPVEETGPESRLEQNLIEGNHIQGAEGLGIELYRASGNRIVNNIITGVQKRTPYPGLPVNSTDPERAGWGDANGAGIWVSPGSDENEIFGNTFHDIASHAIVVEGDSNRIETRSASDAVRDLGSGNRVSRSDSVQARIIDVDGYAVRVFTAGWEHLERGQPVVVFEGGGFSTLDAWGDLPARLAQETAVIAYDRAGSGRSEWDGQRPTLDHVTSRLRRILEVLDAPPPYIHVGHSFGGPLGFAFARQYPDELAGLVLVDPTPPAADWLGAFDDIGVGRAGYDEFDELFSRAFEGAPESLLIELDVLSGYLSDPDASPWSPPDLSVPVAVLLAGAGYEVPPDLPSTFDLDQQHQALLLRQVANYAEWTRTVPDATMIVANNSRHCIHCWDPELVIGAIRRVLYSDVRVQLRQAMAAEGVSAIAPTYDALRSRYPDSHFDESRLESLGRELLGFGESEAAVAVFELNAREYPDVVKPHESLGDAYRAAGRLDDARDSYERASQLAEANASARLPALRRKLEGIEREQQRSQSDSSQDNDRK